jgi:RNA polymerase sigma-70 factor (ECF subfamily)
VEVSARVDPGLRIDQALKVETFQPDPPDADRALVVAARAGDHAAFGRLYERYVRMVHGLVLARVPHRDAADIVHDVFLAAFERLASLRDPGAFGGWLAAIARHRAVDYHRSSTPVLEPADTAGPDGRQQADARAVLAAIQSLPDAYRETLVLRLVEGMTGPEIAERTGLTPGSVRVNLHRGMLQLRAALNGTGRRP